MIKDFYTIGYIDMTSEVGMGYPSIMALTRDCVEITVEEPFTYSIDPKRFLKLVENIESQLRGAGSGADHMSGG